MSKGQTTIPRNRKLWRVHWWYMSEGNEYRRTASVLMTEPDATALALDLQASAQSDPDRKPQVRLDDAAVADYEAERELRRKATKKGG